MIAFLQSGWFWYPLIVVVIILCLIRFVRHGQEDDWDGWMDIDDEHDHH